MTRVPAFDAVPVSYRVDHRYEADGLLVERRRYFWSHPLKQDLSAMDDALVLNMALTARPRSTRVDAIAGTGQATGAGSAGDGLVGGMAPDAGRLLVMLPAQPYRLAAPGGSFRSLHCAIPCARLEAVAGEAVDWAALTPFGGEMRRWPGLESPLARLHEELVRDAIGRAIAIEACVHLACVELARRFRRGRPARPDLHAGGLAAWRVRAILNRIHADRPAPRVPELAALCGLTERQLSRAFKAETGTTIGQAVEEATMERAHRLLTTTAEPIVAIAVRLGFAGADSFSHAYRRHTGTTPGDVRRREANAPANLRDADNFGHFRRPQDCGSLDGAGNLTSNSDIRQTARQQASPAVRHDPGERS